MNTLSLFSDESCRFIFVKWLPDVLVRAGGEPSTDNFVNTPSIARCIPHLCYMPLDDLALLVRRVYAELHAMNKLPLCSAISASLFERLGLTFPVS